MVPRDGIKRRTHICHKVGNGRGSHPKNKSTCQVSMTSRSILGTGLIATYGKIDQPLQLLTKHLIHINGLIFLPKSSL